MGSSDSPQSHDAAPSRDYPLVLHESSSRFFLRYKDEGIRLTPEGLEWRASGAKAARPYGEIRSIRLSLGHVPKSGHFGSCQIEFRHGVTLTVAGVMPWGYLDADRARAYEGFVRDLHRRLSPEDRTRISFVAGATEGRHLTTMIAAVAGGILFVLLPLGLLLFTGQAKALFLTLAGATFLAPVVRLLKTNAPRNYQPDRLDPEFFP